MNCPVLIIRTSTNGVEVVILDWLPRFMESDEASYSKCRLISWFVQRQQLGGWWTGFLANHDLWPNVSSKHVGFCRRQLQLVD